jgi:hypothetical protein
MLLDREYLPAFAETGLLGCGALTSRFRFCLTGVAGPSDPISSIFLTHSLANARPLKILPGKKSYTSSTVFLVWHSLSRWRESRKKIVWNKRPK